VAAGGPARPDQAAGEQPPGRPARDDTASRGQDRGPGPRAGGTRADPAPDAPPPAVPPASSQPPSTGQADAQSAGAQHAGPGRARPRPGGRPDTDTFRQRWPEILDTVRDERKVAWILLRNTSAESVEGTVLTVAFASEGEARSFASSGHEAVLVSAIASLLGVNVRIRPVAAGAGSRGPATAKPGNPPVRGASPPAAPAAADAAAPAAGAPRPAAGGPSGHAPGRLAGQAAGGPGTAPDAAPATAPTDPAAPAPGTSHSSRPASAARRAGAGRGGPPAAGRAGSGRRQPGTTAHGAEAAAEEPWPDEQGSPREPGLSGMELIARQLGGQVIEEIEDN